MKMELLKKPDGTMSFFVEIDRCEIAQAAGSMTRMEQDTMGDYLKSTSKVSEVFYGLHVLAKGIEASDAIIKANIHIGEEEDEGHTKSPL